VAEPTRAIVRRLIDLAAPIVGLNVLNVLSLAVDTAMCGRLPDAEIALTGMGFAVQVAFLLMVAMFGLMIGAVATVARAYGSGDEDACNHVLVQATLLTVGLALAIAVFGNAVAAPLLRGLGASEQALAAGLLYLRPILAGTVFAYLNLLYASLLRGVGNTRLAFAVALVINGLNVLFNYALILGNWGAPALGLTGAAYGTVAAQAIGLAVMVTALGRGACPPLGWPLRLRRLDRELAQRLVNIGTPAAMDMIILNAGFLSIVGMLGRVDEMAVAAHGIGLRVQALAFVPGMSIAQAMGALVGQALGRGSEEDARAVARVGIAICGATMTVLGIGILLAAWPILSLFEIQAGTALGDFSEQWMGLLCLGFPLVGLFIGYGGVLRGSGATGVSLRINALGTLAVQIPLSWILGFPMGLGAFGIWLGFPLSFLAKTSLGYWAYRSGIWAQTGAKIG